MRMLILGADGMIGHKITQILSNHNFEIHLNTRKNKELLEKIFPKSCIHKFDFLSQDILELSNKVFPDFIINAAGITIRRGSENLENAVKLNSELPKKINGWCEANKKKQIHFSTDCVFSGSRGNYSDIDTPDAKDNYGFTKGNGEVNSRHTLTLRSSMIGREIFNKTELFEWIMNSKKKEINGFSRVMYSGVTTIYMARLVADLINNYNNLSGIYNVASKPISKFELLNLINDNFNLGLIINDDKTVISNKTLNASKIEKEIGLEPPSWDELIFELKKDCMNFKDLYKTK